MFKYIAFLFLITQLYALPYRNEIQIGSGYDSNNFELKSSPFKDFETKKRLVNKNINKIVQIKNYEDLFAELNIEKNYSSLESIYVKKLLNDNHINRYTLTYLIYSKIIDFKKEIYIPDIIELNIDSNFTRIYGDRYINAIDYGGEFIALVHIKTKSLNDYKKIDKLLSTRYLSWKNIDKFKNIIKDISKDHSVSIKNIIIADKNIIPANNITDLVNSAKSFKDKINNNYIPFYVESKPYQYNINTENLIPYLKAKYILNNFNYIERNREQFVDKINLSSYKNIRNFILKTEKYNCYPEIEFINSLKNIKYPKRYKYSLIDKPIYIKSINLAQNNILNKYKKIDENIIFKLKYEFEIVIKNSGKVILLNWIKTVYENDKEIHKEKNSKILLDSYVNYKGLKAVSLSNLNYGSIKYKSKFSRFEQNSTIKGEGIINEATCGYKINKIGKLNINCTNIKLKNLKIKFEHIK